MRSGSVSSSGTHRSGGGRHAEGVGVRSGSRSGSVSESGTRRSGGSGGGNDRRGRRRGGALDRVSEASGEGGWGDD